MTPPHARHFFSTTTRCQPTQVTYHHHRSLLWCQARCKMGEAHECLGKLVKEDSPNGEPDTLRRVPAGEKRRSRPKHSILLFFPRSQNSSWTSSSTSRKTGIRESSPDGQRKLPRVGRRKGDLVANSTPPSVTLVKDRREGKGTGNPSRSWFTPSVKSLSHSVLHASISTTGLRRARRKVERDVWLSRRGSKSVTPFVS